MAIAAVEEPDPSVDGRYVDLRGRGRAFVIDVPGPRGAPTVVLLHGWTATAALNWSGVIPTLATRFRVLALDQRGHGRGIRISPLRRFTLADCAEDVVALLDAMRIRRAVIAGYSMGGAVAQVAWRDHAERVAGLVLCSTAASFGTGPLLLRELSAAAHLPGGIFRPAAWPLVARGLYWRATFDAMRRSGPYPLLEAGLELAAFRSDDWIGSVDVPVAVVVTERDNLVGANRQHALAALIPRARTFSVDGDHLAVVGDPEMYGEILLAACRTVSTRGRR